jgi:ribosome-binding protein aMBF1 (putative translation factor)
MTGLAKLRQKRLTDPEVRTEHDRLGPIVAIVGEMTDALLAAGLTQADIAARMGPSQSVVARLERARHRPTFDMVARYAAAIGRRIGIHFVPGDSGHHAAAQG